MRSGGSVLEVPQAPMRGHSPASIVRVPVIRNCVMSIPRVPHIQTIYIRRKGSRYLGEPFLYVLKLAKLNLDGIADMRSGGSVLKALSAAEGALPRERRPRAGCTERYRELEPVRRYW